MAFSTLKTVAMGMLSMPEECVGTDIRVAADPVYLDVWLRDGWMFFEHIRAYLRYVDHLGLPDSGHMAQVAFGIMGPLSMTAHTLSVIGTF